MKYQKCENCGASLVEKDGKYVCEYCKNTYTDNSLEKAYEKVCKTLRTTVEEVVSEGFLSAKIEKIASCRQGLYKARTSEYIDNDDVKFWSENILKLLPDDPQANFYALSSAKRWSEVNAFLKELDPIQNGYLLEGFVDYLTNGQFVERCLLRLNDLIDIAFDENSDEYKNCHKKIVTATEKYNSGTFDVSLPRDVFVAYSSRDKEQAYELVEYLEECGLKCFISMRNLPKGVDAKLYYEKRLKQAIDNCQVFVLVSSKNSRSRDCDAYSVEIAYIKDRDLEKSDDVNYYRNNYDIYVEKYRERCKPRIEFLIEEYGRNIYESQVKNFFKGLSWCVDKDSVVSAVAEYITNSPIEKAEKEKAELERQKQEFEKQKQAEFARQKEEFEKEKNAEIERQRLEFEKQKAEIERQKQEFEKQKAEIERQKQEFAKQKAEMERQKQEFENSLKMEKAEEKPVEQPKVIEQPKEKTVETAVTPTPEFEIENGVLKKYNGTSENVVIPDGVSVIDKYAFSKCLTIKSVNMPSSVTIIIHSAFEYCSNLQKVEFSSSLKRIGNSAFFACKALESIEIPSSVIDIGLGAFSACSSLKEIILSPNVKKIKSSFSSCFSLQNVKIPSGVFEIDECSFACCNNLESIFIPSSVTMISGRAFEGCPNLTIYTDLKEKPVDWKTGKKTIVFESNEDGMPIKKVELSTKEIATTTPKAAGSITYTKNGISGALSASNQRKTSIKEVEKQVNSAILENKGVAGTSSTQTQTKKETETSIKTTSTLADFEIDKGYILKKYKGNGGHVVIPKNVMAISGTPFENEAGKKITTLEFEEGIEKISCGSIFNGFPFSGLDNVKEIIIPASMRDLPINDLSILKLERFIVSKGNSRYCEIDGVLYGIKKHTLILYPSGKKDTSYTVPHYVESIGSHAFWNCRNLIEINLPHDYQEKDGLKAMSLSPFGSRYVLSSLRTIGDNAFGYCVNLQKIDIPFRVAYIGKSAFDSCSKLSDIVIPSTVKELKEAVFFNCTNLSKLYIPENVTKIEPMAICNCPKLTIYAEAKMKPSGWAKSLFKKEDNWNYDKRPVKWGVSLENYKKL